jgi:arginine kinase
VTIEVALLMATDCATIQAAANVTRARAEFEYSLKNSVAAACQTEDEKCHAEAATYSCLFVSRRNRRGLDAVYNVGAVVALTLPATASEGDVRAAIEEAVQNGTVVAAVGSTEVSVTQSLPIVGTALTTHYVQTGGTDACLLPENAAAMQTAALDAHVAVLGIPADRFVGVGITITPKGYTFAFQIFARTLGDYVGTRSVSDTRAQQDEGGGLKLVRGGCKFLSSADPAASTTSSPASKDSGSFTGVVYVIAAACVLVLIVVVAITIKRQQRQALVSEIHMQPNQWQSKHGGAGGNLAASSADDDFLVQQYAASHFYPEQELDPDYVVPGEKDGTISDYAHDAPAIDSSAYASAIQYLETLQLDQAFATGGTHAGSPMEPDSIVEDRAYMDIAAVNRRSKREHVPTMDFGTERIAVSSATATGSLTTWAEEVVHQKEAFASLAAKYLAAANTDALTLEDTAELALCCSGGTRAAVATLGLHARHVDNYTRLDAVFRKVLAEWHGVGDEFKHQNSWELTLPVGAGATTAVSKAAKTTVQLKAYRNFSTFPLSPAMTAAHRRGVEDTFVGVLAKFLKAADRTGRYYSLTEGSPYAADAATLDGLRAKKLMFPSLGSGSDDGSVKAQITADWPTGRGIFVSDDEQLVVYIGGEDHVKVVLTEHAADSIARVFTELVDIISAMETATKVPLAHSDKYGYLTCCPSRVGPALVCQCSIFLPRLEQRDTDSAVRICTSYGATFKYSSNSHFAELVSEGHLCQTEAELASNVRDCITALFDLYGEEREALPDDVVEPASTHY